ncbi:MAG: hypothetical protein AAF823_00205 [Planctomycetota bacterium]
MIRRCVALSAVAACMMLPPQAALAQVSNQSERQLAKGLDEIAAGQNEQAYRTLLLVDYADLGDAERSQLKEAFYAVIEEDTELVLLFDGEYVPVSQLLAMTEPEPAEAAEPAAATEPEPVALPDPAVVEPEPVALPYPAAVEPEPAPAAPEPVSEPEPMVMAEPDPVEPTMSQDMLARVRAAAADQHLIEARQAMADGNFELAVYHLEQAAQIDPNNAAIQTRLAEAVNRRDASRAPRSAIDDIASSRQVNRERALAEYRATTDRAQRFADAGNFASAIDAAAAAKRGLDANQRFLTPEQYSDLLEEAEALQSVILARRDVAVARNTAEAEANRAQTAEDARRQARRERENEVDTLLRRAKALRLEMKYDAALDLVRKALFLEPTSIPAQFMEEVLEDSRILVEEQKLLTQRNQTIARQSLRNLEATIPYEDIIRYPSEWPEITDTRFRGLDESGGESEANRRVALKLREPVPISFDGNLLVDVINFFTNTTGVNFDVRWNQLQAAGVERDAPISLQLTNIPAEEALRRVLQQVSTEFDPVSFSIIEGIVTISTERDLQRTTFIRNYDIRDLLLPIRDFTDVPEFDLNAALEDLTGGGGGGDLFDDTDEEEEVTREELIEQIVTLIQDTVGRQEEWADFGGDISSIREINSQLIIKSTADNHRDIAALLASLRETRSVQISVESRFLMVDDNFLEEIGVDLDARLILDGSKFGPLGFAQDSIDIANNLLGGANPTAPGSTQVASQNVRSFSNVVAYVPSADGVIPVPAVPARSAGESVRAPGEDGITFTDDDIILVPQNGLLSGNGFPGPVFFDNAGNLSTQGTDNQGFDRGITFGASYLDDLQVELLIQATQTNNRAIALTAPRVTFTNGQRAYVLIAQQTTFISDLEPVPDAFGFDFELSVLTTGVVLNVQGAVSADRRYVTLELNPQLAELVNIETFPVNAIFGVDGDDDDDVIETSIVSQGFIQAPEIAITEVAATVSIPDRGTLLIGGQRMVSEVDIEAGVPVLSKLPVINRFFTNSSTQKDESTLLILIRPEIIIQNEQEEELFPGLLDDNDAYNIGRDF